MSEDSPDNPGNPDSPADPPPGDEPAAAQPPDVDPPVADADAAPADADAAVAPAEAAAVPADVAAPAGAAPGNKRKLLLVAGVLVLAIGAIGAVVLLTGGGSDSDSPVGTVETMYKALQDQDCDALFEVMTEATWSEDGATSAEEALDECEISAAEGSETLPEDVELAFDLASEDGDRAVVDVEASFQGQTQTTPIVLLREDGSWKVDGPSTDAAAQEQVDAEAGG